MIFARRSRQTGAAFIDCTAGDHESGDTFARALRRLFGEVPGNDGGVGNVILFHMCGNAKSIDRADRYQILCGTLLDGFTGQIHKHS